MKLSDVKEKIDAYFDSVSPMDIVRKFEALGYEFEKIEEENAIEFHASKIKRTYKPFVSPKVEIVSILAEIQGVSSKFESDVLKVGQISPDPTFSTEQFQGNYEFAMAA